MKTILLLLLSVSMIPIYGQTLQPAASSTENKYSLLNDSLPQVIYKNTPLNKNQTAWFVNSQQAGESVARSLNPEQIASVDVTKKMMQIDNVSYDSQVTITMKEGYCPKLVSLSELKTKYINLDDRPVLFMFENEIVQGDYGKYLVDEHFLLQIIVEKVEVKSGNLDFYLVRLLTRTPENIKKAKEIRLR